MFQVSYIQSLHHDFERCDNGQTNIFRNGQEHKPRGFQNISDVHVWWPLKTLNNVLMKVI